MRRRPGPGRVLLDLAFVDGGDFYSQETANGRPVLVRFAVARLGPDAVRFEQAYSDGGGRSWELSWIATDSRGAG